MSEENRIHGGCFCGSIRFSVAGPESYACNCYCESCQRAAGAPVVTWATFSRDGFAIAEGEIVWNTSSPGVTRGHCATCGTCLTYEHSDRRGEIDVTLNSLDHPDAVRPRSHIWTEDKQPWLVIGDELPQYPQKDTSA